jgi:HlyD family secretion protein
VKPRRILLLVLLTILVAAGVAVPWWVFGRDGAATTAHAAAPRTAVTALGRLEPESEIVAVGLPAGSRVDRLLVEEGAWVGKGEPLAYLDSHGEMAVARDLARAQWEEAKKRFEAESNFGKANVEAAQLRIQQVEEVALLGIQAQEAEVRRSRAELDKAELDLKRSRQMLDDRAIPRSQYDAAVLVVRQGEGQLARNTATLAQLKLDREIKLRLAHADLKSAEAGSQRAKLATQVASLAEALKVARARLERTIIHAPIEGEIIKIFTREGEAAGQAPLLKMGNTHAMFAVAEVYETDVRLVRVGQQATITSKAFPDVNLTGKIEQVGRLIRKNNYLGIDPTADTDARVIEVRIRLDDSSLAARYNYLQVDVSIDIRSPEERMKDKE